MSRDRYPSLKTSDLRWRCDPNSLTKLISQSADRDSKSRSEDTPQKNKLYFTQPKALDSFEIGIQMDAPGSHLFISGPSSTGKTSTVRSLLQGLKRPVRERFDYFYLNNFMDADRTILCQVSAGEGRTVKRLIGRFVDRLPERILSALSSERVERQRRSLGEQLESLYQQEIMRFETECKAAGFALAYTENEDIGRFEIQKVIKQWFKRTQSVPMEEWLSEFEDQEDLTDLQTREINAVIESYERLEESLHQMWDALSETEWEVKRKVFEVEVDEVKTSILHEAHSLDPYYQSKGVEGILSPWVKGIIKWTEDHLEEFKSAKEELLDLKDIRVLKVNLIHEAPDEAPLIFERSPTLINLLGTIERSGDDTHPHLDFADIRGGSLLKANGGILVLNANEMSAESGTWRALLRALKDRSLEIQSPDQLFSSGGGPLKPTSIPLDVKVIAIGEDELYRVLYINSEDFGRVFKIKVEFEDSLPNTLQSVGLYVAHAERVSGEEGLKPFDSKALALWIEFGTRLSGRQDRLSTHLGRLTDILREAAFYAKTSSGESVEEEDMRRALQAQFNRHQLIEDQLFQMMADRLIELTPRGREVGATHGLTVLDFGDHSCGHPCRISATHAPGHGGVVSIEREVSLSGRIHDKGALTLSAYLRAHYLPDHICALHATLAFDQVHDEIDGDSASLAEAIAIISSLAHVDIDQSIAMTGAIDQRGRVQAVGGLNEKIEGFYRLCKQAGLTGAQGVMIPTSNRLDLSLRSEVLQAVDQGQFSIWAIGSIDEALEIVCQQSAGVRNQDLQGGDELFPQGSINQRVRQRLLNLSEIARQFPQFSSGVG